MPLVEALPGPIVRSRAKSAASSSTVLVLSALYEPSVRGARPGAGTQSLVVSNLIAGNVVGVDLRKGARP